jgi:signal transduction histidine kinase
VPGTRHTLPQVCANCHFGQIIGLIFWHFPLEFCHNTMKAFVLSLFSPAVSPTSRPRWKRYGFAFAALLIAFLGRLALDPTLEAAANKHVFTTFIVAIIFTTWYSGFVPSLLTFLAGFLLADYFFLDAPFTFALNPETFVEHVLPPFFVSLTIILFGRSMHLARDLADQHVIEALTNQEKMQEEIAERKRAEAEVRRLNAELELRVVARTAELVTSNQELESFTHSVSHDLRAPLRHLDGYAQILTEEFGPQLPEEAALLLDKIRKSSQNMSQLVDDLLNLSRVGKQPLARQHVPLQPLVESVLEDVKLEARDRDVEWHIGALPDVDCDVGLMKLVFTNLLSNAVKYTRPREHAVIEVGETDRAGETATFVRDNGVGFNMKYANKLFGVFQRLHRAEEFEGTGVGLATVARIIRKHGGKIWAEGEVNKGATFYFTLPAANGKAAPMSHWNGKGQASAPVPATV